MSRRKNAKSPATALADFEHPDSKRTYHHVPYDALIVDPADNYRWGSAEMRDKDLKKRSTTDGNEFSEYGAIKSSLAATGMDVPIWTVPDGDKFRVFAGFTRGHAAQELKMREVPIFVYHDITPAECKMLQLRENSQTLKRFVSWGLEQEARSAQHEILVAQYRSGEKPCRVVIERDSQKKKTLSFEMSAFDEMAESLGEYYTTRRDHHWIYNKLDARVKKLAREDAFGYKTAQEFTNGKDPYTSEFIGRVLEEIMRCKTKGVKLHITPREVQTAKLRVTKWLEENKGADGKPLWRMTQKETAIVNVPYAAADTPRLSPSGVRDMGANFAECAIGQFDLTVDSTPREWEQVRNHPMWARTAGLGLGSGDVVRPADADSIDGCAIGDLRPREFHYVTGIFATAAIRNAVTKHLGHSYSFGRWLAASGKTDHKMALKNAISRAIAEAKEPLVGAIIASAWKYLTAKCPPESWVSAIKTSENRAKEQG